MKFILLTPDTKQIKNGVSGDRLSMQKLRRKDILITDANIGYTSLL